MVLPALLHFIMTSKCGSTPGFSTADVFLPLYQMQTLYLPYLRHHSSAIKPQSVRSRYTGHFQQDLGAQLCTFPTQGPVSVLLYVRAALHASLQGG